jgi:ABC-type uncharacterized transport system auxiliary subunit
MSRSLLLVLALALPSCFSTPPVEEHYYGLYGPQSPIEKGKGPRILVAEFNAAAGYETARIAYRVSTQEMRYYAYRQWVSEPARVLAEMAVRHLRASGRFAEVARGDRIKDPDLILDATVDAMEEFDRGETWNARLAMTMHVRRGDSDRLLFRHSFDELLPCVKRDPDEVARGVSKIYARQMELIARRMSEVPRK